MRDLLWVLYLPAKQCVNSVSAHSLRVSVSHFRLLKRETPTLILSGLWLQHPDVTQVNYKICIEIQQRVWIEKFHNVNGPTYWYAWLGFTQRVISSTTDEWCRRIWVRVHSCKRTTFLPFNLTTGYTFVHATVLVLRKLQVSWCYCVDSEFRHFLFFFLISRGYAAIY